MIVGIKYLIGAVVVSLVGALLLRFFFAVLPVPVSTGFTVILFLFALQYFQAKLTGGIATALKLGRIALNTALGLAIFLALRFLAAKSLGIYPAVTDEVLHNSGGLYLILFGKDISNWILWEMSFMFVAGGLTIAFVRGKGMARWIVGTIFVVSLIALTIQVSFPKYSVTYPSKADLDTELARNGLKRTIANHSGEYPVCDVAEPPIEIAPGSGPVTVPIIPSCWSRQVEIPEGYNFRAKNTGDLFLQFWNGDEATSFDPTKTWSGVDMSRRVFRIRGDNVATVTIEKR
jgi:hypothetical protein